MSNRLFIPQADAYTLARDFRNLAYFLSPISEADLANKAQLFRFTAQQITDPALLRRKDDLCDRPCVYVMGDGTSNIIRDGANPMRDEAVLRNQQLAYELGAKLAKQKVRVLVNGCSGLMRSVVEGAIENGGDVLLVTTRRFLHINPTTGHSIIDDFGGRIKNVIVTNSLPEMASLSTSFASGCVMMPGGYSTHSNILQFLTLLQTRQAPVVTGKTKVKPFCFLDASNYYQNLRQTMETLHASGFLKKTVEELLPSQKNVDDALATLKLPNSEAGFPNYRYQDQLLLVTNRFVSREVVATRQSALSILERVERNALIGRLQLLGRDLPTRSQHPVDDQLHQALSTMLNVVAYGGSVNGNNPNFLQAAQTFGRTARELGCMITYGGGKTGLMWEIVKAYREAIASSPAAALAISPIDFIGPDATTNQEVLNTDVWTVATPDMQARRALFINGSPLSLILPGGIGTMEEIFTEIERCLHNGANKNLILANIDGIFDPLLRMLDNAYEFGFVSESSMPLRACSSIVAVNNNFGSSIEHLKAA